MWVFFNKCNLIDEIAKLEHPSFSSSPLKSHVFAVKTFLSYYMHSRTCTQSILLEM